MKVYPSPWINRRRNGQFGAVPFLSDVVDGEAVQVTPNGIARSNGTDMERDPTGGSPAFSMPPAKAWRGNRSGE